MPTLRTTLLKSMGITAGIVIGATSLVTNGIQCANRNDYQETIEAKQRQTSALEQKLQEHDIRLPSWDLFLSDTPEGLAKQGYRVAIFNVGPDKEPRTTDDIPRYALRIDENGKMVGIEEITVVPTRYKTGKTESPIK